MEAVPLSRRIGRTAPFSDTVAFEMAPGTEVGDDAALEKAVIAAVDGYSHPTSTVPMGVMVDADGAMREVEGLRVVDASIMPDIVSAPTNVTTIRMVEAIARRL